MAGDVPADERILITIDDPDPGADTRRGLLGPRDPAAGGGQEDSPDPTGLTSATGAAGALELDATGAGGTARGLLDDSSLDDMPVWGARTRRSTAPAGAGGNAGAQHGERTVHRYGRVRVLGRPHAGPAQDTTVAAAQDDTTGTTGTTTAQPAPGDGTIVSTLALPGGLSRTESLGVEAFRLRASDGYRRRKRSRPRDAAPWDMARPCTDIAPARGSGTSVTPRLMPTLLNAPSANGTDAAQSTAGAPGTSGLSSYLEGSVAVGLILVEGPTAALRMSAAERTKIVAEVQNGLSWYATQNPAAELTFSYDIQLVQLSTPADPGASDLESVWRNPAMSRLGYAPTFDGVYDYVEGLRGRLGTKWAYCAFVTKYPLGHFAYASIGGPRLVLAADADGWGPDNIDRVFAHETGHIFGAPDEYAGAGCDCGGSWGRYGVPNGNCDACAPAPVDCLMRANTFALCRYTPAHIGWGHGVSGNPVLIQSRGLGVRGNFDVVVPSAFSGLTHVWRENDARDTPWRDPWQTAQALGRVDAVTMLQSTLATPGPLETVVRVGSRLFFLWRDSTGAFQWRPPVQLTQNVGGVPSMVQSRLGGRGNFELLAPAADVGIIHMWRNHDVAGYPWSAPKLFAANLGRVDAVSLIHGTLGGGAGLLEAVALVGTRLVHLTRDSSAVWRTNGVFAEGVSGNPVLIQSLYPGARNFEVVVPAAGTGLIHFFRDNNRATPAWSGPRPFGASLGHVDSVALIQSNYSGNLEVLARVANRLYLLTRSGADAVWSTPQRVL
ncbi:hypothetical protein CcI49_02580 [Frankia sp. CcI49]|uniref:hypothetical protein n=1 Tax=Frankia sp. CcI49 TaxID=1745382 RepID=UPI000977AA30|nr:hypothetical protein [Frankia sp. CcI49]ONH62286.1 hypothetical protein CcI49_02580 [Frankia sp. CcI49]